MGGQITADLVWRRAPTPVSFQMISCGGYNIHAVDSMQQVWKLDMNTILDCHWTQMEGRSSYIEGTEGKQLWCATGNDEIFYYYYGWTGSRWERVNGALSMISVGKGQYIWGINRQGEIFKTNEKTKVWTKMPGAAQNLSVGRDGSCWCVNANCEIWRWETKNVEGFEGQWVQVPGSLRQISVYDADTVCGTNMYDDILYWDTKESTWKQFSGKLRHVAVGAKGYRHVWGVNSQGEVWFHRDQFMENQLVEAARRKIAAANPQINTTQHHHTTPHHTSTGYPAQSGVQVGVNTGGYPAQSGVQVGVNTGGYPAQSGVQTGYPAQSGVQVGVNTGGYPAQSGVQTGYPSTGY